MNTADFRRSEVGIRGGLIGWRERARTLDLRIRSFSTRSCTSTSSTDFSHGKVIQLHQVRTHRDCCISIVVGLCLHKGNKYRFSSSSIPHITHSLLTNLCTKHLTHHVTSTAMHFQILATFALLVSLVCGLPDPSPDNVQDQDVQNPRPFLVLQTNDDGWVSKLMRKRVTLATWNPIWTE